MVFSEQCQRRSVYLLTQKLISVHGATRQRVDKLVHIRHLPDNTTQHINYIDIATKMTTTVLQAGLVAQRLGHVMGLTPARFSMKQIWAGQG